MRKLLVVCVVGVSLLALPAGAAAKEKEKPTQVRYGVAEHENAELYPKGEAVVLLLHELGGHWQQVAGEAEFLQNTGGFTVLDVEWQTVPEKYGDRIWGSLTGEIKRLIADAREHEHEWKIDSTRLTMVGGSRGANLSLLTSLKANAVEPGTVKAVVSLSGDTNVPAQIKRNREAIEKPDGEELDKSAINKISKSYGCEKELTACPLGCPLEPPACCSGEPLECTPNYIEKWSAYQLVTEAEGPATAPAMFLAASKEERKTADWEDQQPLAEALGARGVSAEVDIPKEGHGFVYWPQLREAALAFLQAHDGG